MNLSDRMAFDHVIRVHDDGTVTDVDDVYAPEFKVSTDKDGQILDIHEKWMIEELRSYGWEPLTGFTGQYGYNGPILHQSEVIGGGLEKHILENPGLYVAVVVEDYEYDAAGWMVLFRAE